MYMPPPDDEPEVGPSCYYILTGFNSTEVFKHLAPIKLKADALVKVEASKKVIPDTPGKYVYCTVQGTASLTPCSGHFQKGQD